MPSSRARAAAQRPAMPAPAISTLREGERRLVLDVLGLDALGPPDEDRVGVRRVDDVSDIEAELLRLGDVLVDRLDLHREMVQQRPLRVARLTFVELDERATNLYAR